MKLKIEIPNSETNRMHRLSETIVSPIRIWFLAPESTIKYPIRPNHSTSFDFTLLKTERRKMTKK